jgi:hypothetical protein
MAPLLSVKAGLKEELVIRFILGLPHSGEA